MSPLDRYENLEPDDFVLPSDEECDERIFREEEQALDWLSDQE